MQDWADAFDAPIYLHASDREWVMRDSPRIVFWEGDSLCKYPRKTHHSLLEIFRHTDYVT